MAAYRGQNIAYEGQTYYPAENAVHGDPTSGNPISYYNGARWTFAWEKGRQLSSATKFGTTVTYEYDLNGIRSSKTVNGTAYNFLTQNGKVVRQTWGSNIMDFVYDNAGMPYAMVYNGSTYYYILNQQGDVIRIVDDLGGTQATYTYNAWGKQIASSGWLAAANPIRYRGYYYDNETGFYYLQSRYYDPSIGRFINADALVSTGQEFLGYNMFAYCRNNPVNNADPAGLFASEVWEFTKNLLAEIGKAINDAVPAYTSCATFALTDGPVFYSDAVALVAASLITLSAVGLGTYQAIKTSFRSRSETIAKNSSPQYWEAYRVKNNVVIGRGISFVEASIRVSCGLDVICANQSAAKWIIVINGYWNAVGPEIHGDDGYYWHYHQNRSTHTHIWYY